MKRYHVTLEATIDAKNRKRLAKLLDRMLDAGGDAVTQWDPTVTEEADMSSRDAIPTRAAKFSDAEQDAMLVAICGYITGGMVEDEAAQMILDNLYRAGWRLVKQEQS